MLLKYNISFACFIYSQEHSFGNQVAWIISPLCVMTSDGYYHSKELTQSLHFAICKIEIIKPPNNPANLLRWQI